MLKFAGIEEGRMLYNDQSGAFDREGFLLDHLGNVRVVFADNDSDGVAEVVQENHYYPFGLSMGALNYTNTLENKFKYNLPFRQAGGKELDDEAGLRWYDYGFRRYDPQIGRWHVVDALAEKYLSSSPYVYVKNNPVLFIDPNGLNRLMFGHNSAGNAFGACNFGRKIFGPGSNSTHTAWEINVESMHYTTDEDYQRWREAYDKGYTNLGFKQWKRIYTNAMDYGIQGSAGSPTTTWMHYLEGSSSTLLIRLAGNTKENAKILAYILFEYPQLFPDYDFNFKIEIDFELTEESIGLPEWAEITNTTLSSIAIARGVKLSIIDFAAKADPSIRNLKYVKGIKIVGRTSGVLSGAFTVGEVVYQSEIRASNILDAAVTGVTFIPGFGWAVGGTYFLADIITRGITGKDIGEHLDSGLNGGLISDW